MAERTILLGFGRGPESESLKDTVAHMAPDMQVLLTLDDGEIAAHLDTIEIAAGRMPRHMLVRAPRLRWMQQWGAGADWLLRDPDAVAAPFVLTSASGVHAQPIGEHIMAFLLAFSRGLHRAVRAQARGVWERPEGNDGISELAGQTMLLIGVGAIGRRTAELAAAFGMRVLGVRRNAGRSEPAVDEMHSPDALHDLLPRADAVVLTVPLTEETRGMIGERELGAMKRSAVIVNIGRGGTIQEGALVRALQEGWIAGAGLDVFAEEPLPPDSPLWGLANVIITAHYSGRTPHYDARASAIFVENLRRYLAGEPLQNVVEKRLGY